MAIAVYTQASASSSIEPDDDLKVYVFDSSASMINAGPHNALPFSGEPAARAVR
jgi:hypothetical protein